MNRIKNFINLLKTIFNSRILRTILGALVFFVGLFGYIFYIAEPAVKTFGDGVWWALVTVTTVGYGDITPLTTLGRLVAGALMFLGLGLIATVTALVSANFIRNYVDSHTNDDVLAKLADLELEIEKLKELELNQRRLKDQDYQTLSDEISNQLKDLDIKSTTKN